MIPFHFVPLKRVNRESAVDCLDLIGFTPFILPNPSKGSEKKELRASFPLRLSLRMRSAYQALRPYPDGIRWTFYPGCPVGNCGFSDNCIHAYVQTYQGTR